MKLYTQGGSNKVQVAKQPLIFLHEPPFDEEFEHSMRKASRFFNELYYFQIAMVPSSQETVSVSLLGSTNTEGSTNLASKELMYLAPVAVPRWGIVAPFLQDHEEYPKGAGDMDVAEDIIFRPLFRYRQELQDRSRYSNRRYYDSYPRRSYYRSQYDDY